MEELEIIIPKDGTISVNVKGVKGARCLAITKGLELAAGSVTARTFAASYYEQERTVFENIAIKKKEG
ncbi:MAG TPA: DUF2997 domain-containing protein [Methanoregulaceae archaeon]|nr:DUF2997 domain-containing protein [Methanoregulaceae archaeon]